MANQRRNFLLWAAALFTAVACGLPPPKTLTILGSTLGDPRWDAPEQETNPMEPITSRPLSIALSKSGDRIAFPIPNKRSPYGRVLPSEGLLILDLGNQTATKLSYRTPTIELVDPAFSPDGATLAMVATPVPRFGWGEIWITSVDGQPARRIKGHQRSYMSPQFSADSGKLAFFGDIWTPESNPTMMWPEYRSRSSAQPWGVFEMDLSSSREERLSDMGWGVADQIRYDGSLNGIVVWAHRRLKLVELPQGPAWRPMQTWEAPFPAPKGAEDFAVPRTVVLKRAGASWSIQATPPPPPAGDDTDVRLLDVTSSGHYWAINPASSSSSEPVKFVRTDGASVAKLFDSNDLPRRSTGGVYPRGLFFSDDGCTAAYWAGSIEAPEIGVVKYCKPDAIEVQLLSIPELADSAKRMDLNWTFGDSSPR